MDSHEPYYDDEDQRDSFPSSFSSDDPPSPPRMKPMSVSTGEFASSSSGYFSNSTNRKALVASIVAVVFLIFGLIVTEERRSADTPVVIPDGNDRGHLSGFGGSGSKGHDGPCDAFDAAYFNDLLFRVQTMNETDPALCTTEFKIADCKCRHPLRPSKQTEHPGWKTVIDMNVKLMEQNYSNFPPDVVLYGDAMVEHLIGRNYGHTTKDYEETALVTQQLMTKRGGGHINALPMGISADQIANLLYRIQSGGEMPETLHPKVWWVLIGAMDLGMGCSIDSVVAGNIGIVKEIRERHNNQHGHKTLTPVVMNSLLPRGRHEFSTEQSSWSTIRRINEQLECYAEVTPGVYFVNATDIFIKTNATGTFLNESLIMPSDYLHPSTEGNRQWEEMIVSNVMQLMT